MLKFVYKAKYGNILFYSYAIVITVKNATNPKQTLSLLCVITL